MEQESLYLAVCWTWWNLYAFYRASWDPTGDPWEWARDCCILQFGRPGAEVLADALMMTEEIATRTFHVTAFSGAKRDAYAITHRCCFTDGRHYYQIVKDPHEIAYKVNHVRGKVPAFLKKMEETRKLSQAMLERARIASVRMGSSPHAQPVLESFKHFSALVEILTHYQQALVLRYYKDESGLEDTIQAAARADCAYHAVKPWILSASIAKTIVFTKTRGWFLCYGLISKKWGMICHLRSNHAGPSTFRIPKSLIIDGKIDNASNYNRVWFCPKNHPIQVAQSTTLTITLNFVWLVENKVSM